jgi:hypothetical protein
MIFLIGVVVFFAGLAVMSRRGAALFFLVFISSLIFCGWAWYRERLGGGGLNGTELQILLSLSSINAGVFVFSAAFGILRSLSKSEQIYVVRRKQVLFFLAKWGAIYTLFSIVAKYLIDAHSGEMGMGWAVMRIGGVYFFAIVFVLYYVSRYWRKRRLSKLDPRSGLAPQPRKF